MYAVVKISGKQWKVETQNRILVDKLPFKKDEIVPLDQVLLIRQENKITIVYSILLIKYICKLTFSKFRAN